MYEYQCKVLVMPKLPREKEGEIIFCYNCTVVRVIDGDTADISVDLGFRVTIAMRFRLAGINAPEMRTFDGPKSKQRLSELMPIGSQLIVKTSKDKQEKYGRYLGTFWDAEQHEINARMVQEGFAVPYPPNPGLNE